jgi:hypothetical protein
VVEIVRAKFKIKGYSRFWQVAQLLHKAKISTIFEKCLKIITNKNSTNNK